MATPKLQTVMQKIESRINAEITADGTLPFMVRENTPVMILSEPPEGNPKKAYRSYLVALWPDPAASVVELPRLGGLVRREYNVGISLFRKLSRKSRWRIFSDSNDPNTGVGIYEFCNLIMDILRNDSLDGTLDHSGNPQFSDIELVEGGDTWLERIDFHFHGDSLETTTSGVA